mgnify:CR=1 FL=1
MLSSIPSTALSSSKLADSTDLAEPKWFNRALLNHFGSARAVESASFDDLKSVEGIEDSIAKKIYNYFHE